jgi:predicted hotdog family 3-hydroxylacyl-ACP dehydratase
MPLNGAAVLDRAWIEAHIPHQGSMCLLDEVLSWDSRHLRCRSGSHRSAAHPLRSHGRLGIACGIEYAAQAMAVHGAIAGAALAGAALADGTRSGGAAAKAEVGFLAGLRDVRMHVQRLDDIESDLICEVRRIAGDASTALYWFDLSAAQRSLLEGRATVVLDAKGRLTGYLSGYLTGHLAP